MSDKTRVAACGCGALTAATRGEPVIVYGCSCLACQRKSGSAFSYAAVFPEASVAIAGAHNAWRHTGDSGRWVENLFCPTCGVSIAFRSEGFTGMMGVAVGCFADPDFAAPSHFYWGARRTAGSPCRNASQALIHNNPR